MANKLCAGVTINLIQIKRRREETQKNKKLKKSEMKTEPNDKMRMKSKQMKQHQIKEK